MCANTFLSFFVIYLMATQSLAMSNRATLKRKLLFDYDKTSIPDEKVTFGIEIHPMNLDLCPKTQVTKFHYKLQSILQIKEFLKNNFFSRL